MSSRTRAHHFAAISVLVLMSFSPSSFADRDPNGDCETRSQTFATELATVHALSQCYATLSAKEDREYFAAILQAADGFVFVVGAGTHHKDQISLRIGRLQGETFVALWHTHGAKGPNREFFSPTDTALVKQVGVPFYLVDPNGDLHVFRPGDPLRAPPKDRTTGRAPFGAAMGTVLAANMSASVPLVLGDR
jgi:hypothetical protein